MTHITIQGWKWMQCYHEQQIPQQVLNISLKRVQHHMHVTHDAVSLCCCHKPVMD